MTIAKDYGLRGADGCVRPDPTVTRGVFGTLSSTDTPLEVVHRWRERMEARVTALEAQVQRQQTALTLARRFLRGELGAVSAAEVTAAVETAEAYGEDAARESMNSYVAGLESGEPG